MKLVHHKDLTPERWYRFSLMEQFSNVGSDVLRAIRWKNKQEEKYSKSSFERSLELFDLTISDPKNRRQLKEVLRVREAWVDYFLYDNVYGTSDVFWQDYFNDIGYVAAIQRGR